MLTEKQCKDNHARGNASYVSTPGSVLRMEGYLYRCCVGCPGVKKILERPDVLEPIDSETLGLVREAPPQKSHKTSMKRRVRSTTRVREALLRRAKEIEDE